MKEVDGIKHKRYSQLIKNSLKPGKQITKANRVEQAKKKVHLLRAPVADTERGKSNKFIKFFLKT